MTTPDLSQLMSMQWVWNVNPTLVSTSQTLTIKYGRRSVDDSNRVAIEPGVYMFSWDTNLPDGQWKSWYFRDVSNFESVFTNFGSRDVEGRRRIVIPKKAWLYCHASLDTQINVPEPVTVTSLLPVAPLANAFET